MKDGEPDGIFCDNAMPLVIEKIPVPDKETVKKFIQSAVEALNAYGVTSCHSDDYSVFRSVPFEVVNEAFRGERNRDRCRYGLFQDRTFTVKETLDSNTK